MAKIIRPLPRVNPRTGQFDPIELQKWRESLRQMLDSDLAILLSRIDASDLTAGSVLFVLSTGAITGDIEELFWDTANNILKIANTLSLQSGKISDSSGQINVDSNAITGLRDLIFIDEDRNIGYVGDLTHLQIKNLLDKTATESISNDWTWLLANKILFRDSGIFINSITDGHLDLTADISIDLNAPFTLFGNGEFPVIDKASGNGIKVDTTTPTFGFRDLLGFITTRPTAGAGAAAVPAYQAYRGSNIFAYMFGTNAPQNHLHETFVEFHIPHDYVPGTDLFIHVHWSQETADTGAAGSPGDAVWTFEFTYASGYDTDAFPASKIISATQTASTTQYSHMIAEVQFTNDGGDATHIDRADIDVDGLLLIRISRVTGGSDTLNEDTFMHFVDVHYQTTGIVGTKDKNSPFYV